jgi:hypothetical protein
MNSSPPKPQTNAFVYIGLNEAAAALDAGDPTKAVAILEAMDHCAPADIRNRIYRIHEQANIGDPQQAETLLELLLSDLQTQPRTITLYAVHSDTDTGADLELFTDSEAERKHCEELMRAKGNQSVLTLLDQGTEDSVAAAWQLFTEQESDRQRYHFRHEQTITIPAL